LTNPPTTDRLSVQTNKGDTMAHTIATVERPSDLSARPVIPVAEVTDFMTEKSGRYVEGRDFDGRYFEVPMHWVMVQLVVDTD
jgi:hypothetical protein